MKKVSIVLLMGLAIGMTFMSCSKEEVQNDCEKVIEFSTRLSETEYDLIHIVKVEVNGVIYKYQVTEAVWYNLKAEESQNGFACLTTLN